MDTRILEKLREFTVANEDDIDRIIIGLDFGTTYSGIAYAFSTKPDQVFTITEWPGAQGRNFPKTPTVIKYESPDKFKWGYELDRCVGEKIVGIKLFLDPDQERPLYDPSSSAASKKEMEKLSKSPFDIVSDYIGAIYQHALTQLATKVPKTYLEMLDKRFILSVPAVWSDKAKDTTLKAAQKAGIAPIELIKEPEAAALFTLHYLKHQGLDEGDAITICDCGGGTVDLVSYEIVQIVPLQLKELAPPTGGIAGSLLINKRFEHWVKDMVGERTFLDLKETNGFRLAVKNFDEAIKPGFRSKEDEDIYVTFPMANIPDDLSKGIKSQTIILSGTDLYGIFEPVFRDIDRLVAEQISKVRIKRLENQHPKGSSIKAIFLVGGFGSSLFLKEAIASAHKDIQVIQPNDAWSAIVRGAVLSKLPREASVISSVADKHYGVVCASEHDETRDKGQEKTWDPWYEIYRTRVMVWYINKNDDLDRSRKIAFSFSNNVPMDATPDDYKFTYKLMMCPTDFTPTHPDENTTKNCVLEIDLGVVPQDKFKKRNRKSDGKRFQSLSFKLVVRVEGARLVFSFECGDQEYGAVDVQY